MKLLLLSGALAVCATAAGAQVAGPGRPIPYTELKARSAAARAAPARPAASAASARTGADQNRTSSAAGNAPTRSDDTAGAGGDMGVAPGSAAIGEPGAISKGAGSTGGGTPGALSPGQTASGMVQSVTPPGERPD